MPNACCVIAQMVQALLARELNGPLPSRNELRAQWLPSVFFKPSMGLSSAWAGSVHSRIEEEGAARGATERSPCPLAPPWFKAFKGPQWSLALKAS